MPTGYTADVQEGRVTTFREFALKCARAMGANVLMRDEPMDAVIVEYVPSGWSYDRLIEAREDLARAEKMTFDEALRLEYEQYTRIKKERNEARAQRDLERQRYEAMLREVRAWTPPSGDHEEFKQFMIEQLERSISFDCGDTDRFYDLHRKDPAQFRAELVKEARRHIEYYEKEWDGEVQRTRERNEWNRKLIESLKK